MSLLSSGTSIPFQDPCHICHYPSWTEARAEKNEASELQFSSFEELHLSSTNGCLGCEVLVQAWQYGTPEADIRAKENITFNKNSTNLYVHIFKHPRGIANIEVFTIAQDPTFKHVRPAALIPSSTNLSENLARIMQWLHACEERHGICSKPNNQIPPRLLDLETSSSGIVCLVELDQLQMSSEGTTLDFRYACLSHCWGKTRHKHLTRKSNLAANFEGIPVVDLSQTFRDAITISRSIGIRYLWIDSLCIIQDEHADWKLHVDKMANIYRNAYITLAAGASPDDAGGFFRKADLSFTSPSSFKKRDQDIEYTIYMRKCLPHPDEDWPAGPSLPLLDRGWVFQERLLSRRFLCFGANEVLWECLEDVACSCSTTTDGFKGHGQPKAFPNCRPSKFEFTKIEDLSREEIWSLWRQLVSQYTQRDLSFPDDKLPALAGLARRFQDAKTGRYIYGMWADCIKKDMLWQPRGYTDDESRLRKAPSWSWVSAADGGVEWEWNLQDPRIEDIHLLEKAHGDDTVHEANSSLLSLRGHMAHVSLQKQDISNGMEVFKGFRCCLINRWTSGEDCSPISKTPQEASTSESEDMISEDCIQRSLPMVWPTAMEGIYGELWADYKFWSNEETLWHIVSDIFLLDLGIEKELPFFGFEEPRSCRANGLMLRACNGQLDGTLIYERIGWLRYMHPTWRDEWKPAGTVTQILIE